MYVKNVMWLVAVLLCISACRKEDGITLSGLEAKKYQTEVDGQLTDLYVLRNKNGMEACITNYGARLVSLMVPDRHGKLEDVVCGFDSISDYLNYRQNFGATVGRYIGRILNGTFTLDSVTYKLDTGGTMHCSHGGYPGFSDRIWQAEKLTESAIKMSLVSHDGENGFPGNLNVYLVYRLTEDNALDISYEATTDKPTVLNLSHHSFFNISGDFHTTVEDQILYIDADSITPYDSTKCVTGEFMAVSGTPFDFTEPLLIGNRIDEDNFQLNITGGYDHCWVLNTQGDDTKPAVRLIDKKSGRTLEVYTNEPGVQVYTANGLRGKLVGKKGIAYDKRTSVCLETQHFSDSPNKPQFPSTILRPDEKYVSRCMYKFGIFPLSKE